MYTATGLGKQMSLLLIVLFLILVAELINGWTDAPNAIATVISTRTLSPRVAILSAAFFNIIGAFAGTAVAETIGTGFVKPDVINLATLGAAMVSIISWGVFAWIYGIPISKSHALVAGLTGAGLAEAGPSALLWEGWEKVLVGLLLSTIFGGLGGFVCAKLVQFCFATTNPSSSRKTLRWLQLCSSASVAFSHGSNDGQKFMGTFALALLVGGWHESFYVPLWVIILCAGVMGLGTSIGGMRIIRTMGFKMVRLETYQGFAAETAAAGTILFASSLGVPLSTTNTIGSAIMGVGVARRANQVHWSLVSHIIFAWVLTFPICGAIAFVCAFAVKFLGLIGLCSIMGALGGFLYLIHKRKKLVFAQD
jgi:PiT family inorganic phosphate transporter